MIFIEIEIRRNSTFAIYHLGNNGNQIRDMKLL
jgi:hypothetical protein